MIKLIRGIHHFQNDVFRTRERLFQSLAEGQEPETLFITCSDSRIDPNLLTQSEPGELFILRNAGNLVPPYGHIATGETATIEFAVTALKIKSIIICGHSHCGAMKGLLHPEQLTNLPAVAGWLVHAESTRRIVQDNYPDLDDDRQLNVAIQENVLVQLERLQTQPAVASRLVRGDLTLHGWVYKIETGEVFSYDAASGQFVPVAEHKTGDWATRSGSIQSI
ncbi:MAG: carbonic anhydrase [Isosphaeraceae bacterium]